MKSGRTELTLASSVIVQADFADAWPRAAFLSSSAQAVVAVQRTLGLVRHVAFTAHLRGNQRDVYRIIS